MDHLPPTVGTAVDFCRIPHDSDRIVCRIDDLHIECEHRRVIAEIYRRVEDLVPEGRNLAGVAGELLLVRVPVEPPPVLGSK